MKYLFFPIFLLTILAQNGCAKDTIQSHLNIDNSSLAVQGYDPVSYHNGAPQKGLQQYSYNYDGAVYLFANKENRNRFTIQPAQFLPGYGGWCAWAMLDGEKVRINPKTYKIIDGTTYLYYNFFFVNTLSQWNRLAKKEGEEQLVTRAHQAWTKLNQ